jgi:hypothetical protein
MRDVAAMVECNRVCEGFAGKRRFGALLEGLGMGAMALFVAQGGQSGVGVGAEWQRFKARVLSGWRPPHKGKGADAAG